MAIRLYNTLTKKLDNLEPITPSTVSMYTCGPTVYDYAHLGNLRTYIFEDLLRRVLIYNHYEVEHAMNITDVGHLASDADEGEDKIEKGAIREGKHPLEIARFYEEKFFIDCNTLNILPPHKVLRATESIDEQIEIIKLLQTKGYTYQDEFAIYFDTSKLADYGKLSGQKLNEKKIGARAEVVIDNRKRNPQDFVLWFFVIGKYEHHILRWSSPWGDGFPGWHIECSAIARKLLGQPFDIHCGGVDHIGTHHTNEIAQSEAAFNTQLANYWMHGEFLLINGGRMGKSEGNLRTLDSLINSGYSPLAFRYLTLTAHYRTQLNFTEANLQASQTAIARLYNFARTTRPAENGIPEAEEEFLKAVNEDLNIPNALALTWKMLNSDFPEPNKLATLLKFDEVFGLSLKTPQLAKLEIPKHIQALLKQRIEAKKSQDFKLADAIREKIQQSGYELQDTPEGQKIIQKNP